MAAVAIPALAAAQQPPTPPSTQPSTQTESPPESKTQLSGYMDFHYTKPQFLDGEIDFHRFVLLVTHRYSDRIRFVGELEVAHAFVEGFVEAGELELEQT